MFQTGIPRASSALYCVADESQNLATLVYQNERAASGDAALGEQVVLESSRRCGAREGVTDWGASSPGLATRSPGRKQPRRAAEWDSVPESALTFLRIFRSDSARVRSSSNPCAGWSAVCARDRGPASDMPAGGFARVLSSAIRMLRFSALGLALVQLPYLSKLIAPAWVEARKPTLHHCELDS